MQDYLVTVNRKRTVAEMQQQLGHLRQLAGAVGGELVEGNMFAFTAKDGEGQRVGCVALVRIPEGATATFKPWAEGITKARG